MEAKVRFVPERNKWRAFVRYRGVDCKYVYQSRLFPTKNEADEGLQDLVAAHRDQAIAFQTTLIAGGTKPTYQCPLCNEHKLFKNRRVARHLDGSVTVICVTCYRGKSWQK